MVVDLFLVYQFIRRLATPFNKWEAYKQGIIDKDGKVLIKSKDFTKGSQRKAWGVFDRMIANLKKLLAKIPGGSSRFASYAAALFLIKEYKHFTDESLLNEEWTDEQLDESMHLFHIRYNHYTILSENVNGYFDKLDEKLKASDDMGVWVKDFQKSDAPQFKGKSQKKRQQMAVAAKLDAMDEAPTNMRNIKLVNKIKKSGVVKSGSMSQNDPKKSVDTKPEITEEMPANAVSTGAIANMDASGIDNKKKKKKIKDMMRRTPQ
jgi:hypothetical protein